MSDLVDAKTLAETRPSDPATGEFRQQNRTLAGALGGAIATGIVWSMTKIGMDIPEELALAVGGWVVLRIEKFLARVGKMDRQSESPTGMVGKLF